MHMGRVAEEGVLLPSVVINWRQDWVTGRSRLGDRTHIISLS